MMEYSNRGISVKVLLVQSPTGSLQAPIFPIGLAFIAGQLHDHEIRGLDLSLHYNFNDILKLQLDEFRPDVVAVSLRNIDDSAYPVTYSYLEPFGVMMEVLGNWQGTLVVGGTGFSIYPGIVLERYPRIDFGIPGEAEELFPSLLQHIEKCTGIQDWDGGRELPWGHSHLDLISPPDYSFIDISPYKGKNDAIGIQTRRGCEFSCTYCTYGYLGGKIFRRRSVESVLEDMRALEDLGIRRFSFVDSVFNAPEDYFEELLDAIETAGSELQWSAWIDEKITPEQLSRMKRTGAVAVDISPDAITDRGLRKLGKRSKAADLMPAVRAARATGLQVMVNFFNGNPGEGFFSLLRKLWFMVRVRTTLGLKDTFVHIGTIRVYAHSPIAREMKAKGDVEKDCDFFEPVFCRTGGPADWLYRLFQSLLRLRHG